MLYEWNSENIIIWISSMMSSTQWLLAQTWRNCWLQKWRLTAWEVFSMSVWFPAGNKNCFWHIHVSHFRYTSLTVLFFNSKILGRREKYIWKVLITLLNRFLEDGQVPGDESSLREISEQESWYLGMLKFCYQVHFLLLLFFDGRATDPSTGDNV